MKTMKNLSQELYNGSAEKTHNNDSNSKATELTEFKTIENTPFTAVRVDKDWFLTMGKYRVTERLNTYEEAEQDALRSDWDRVMQVIGIMIKEFKD